MTRERPHAVRELDLAQIDAVGFDLDHTLAVYDDARVNTLACEETLAALADVAGVADVAAVRYDAARVCRGLLIDTEAGPVVKPDAAGRVRRARRAGAWLSRREIDVTYAAAVESSGRFHAIHSPFDLPTAFFYQELAARYPDFATACTTIRRELDRAHTGGRFKRRVLDDAGTLVRDFPGGVTLFERLREAGKRLFVLTNSETHYTQAILERLFGPRPLFDVVVAEARKPQFFDDDGAPQFAGALVTGGGARWLEGHLGVSPARVLYVGDNVAVDALPARRRGWRTALVVPELGENAGGDWGPALFDGNAPTWFAAMISTHADVYAPSVGALFGRGPAARFVPGRRHPLAGNGLDSAP